MNDTRFVGDDGGHGAHRIVEPLCVDQLGLYAQHLDLPR